jgi:hypothetical protein
MCYNVRFSETLRLVELWNLGLYCERFVTFVAKVNFVTEVLSVNEIMVTYINLCIHTRVNVAFFAGFNWLVHMLHCVLF